MAGAWCQCYVRVSLVLPLLPRSRFDGFRCCSNNNKKKDKPTSQVLKVAVSGATEILRFFSSFSKDRFYKVAHEQNDGPSACGIDDVIMILKSDYENAYFVTGIFTLSIYAEDCIFEDPTIKFRGTELYSRNLKLLVPFFELPSISLQSIEKVQNHEREFILSSWKLRTYLKLPWRPLISIDGTTVYDMDNQYKIVRHVESWNVSPLEAIGQIFTPSFVVW